MTYRKSRTTEERLSAKTERAANGCLVWIGARLPSGYGRIWDGEKAVYSHRLAWQLANGPIPDGMQVDHLCFNTSCCEVSHLRLTTQSENQQHRQAAQSNSSTGHRGVYFTRGKFEARVQANNRIHYGGRYDTADEAATAADALRTLHHIQ